MLKVIALCLFIICFSFPVAHGDLYCYSCLIDGGATDRSCLNNPAAVANSNPIAKCPTHCTIVRTEYENPPGQIFTFRRGCDASTPEGVSVGGGFKVYTRICTSYLCNDWDGIAPNPGGGSGNGAGGGSGGSGSGGIGSGDNNSGNSNIILVEGSGKSGTGNQQDDLYVAIITASVAMKLYM